MRWLLDRSICAGQILRLLHLVHLAHLFDMHVSAMGHDNCVKLESHVKFQGVRLLEPCTAVACGPSVEILICVIKAR